MDNAERLLYDYPTHDLAIAELQADLNRLMEIYEPTPKSATMRDDVVTGGDSTSQPERWAIMIDQNRDIKSLRERIDERKRHKQIVEEAKRRMNENERKFVELYYEQNLSARKCAERIGYHVTQIYRIKRRVESAIYRYIS